MTSTARPFPFPATHPMDVEPAYAELRADEPVVRVLMPHGGEAWLATRYEDVTAVFTDPRFSRAAAGPDVPRMAATPPFGGSVNKMEGEDHLRLRSVISPAFMRSAMGRLRPRVQEITDDLIGRIQEKGAPADLVPDFSELLPVMVMCEVLGVPFEDRSLFRSWSNTVLSNGESTAQEYTEADRSIHAYVAGLIEREPVDGILGVLVEARKQHRVSDEEIISLAGTLLVGGHSTLVSQISKSFLFLLTHREIWAELCADPGVVRTAVEELLRYIPLGVGAGNPRIATEDVELSGVLIKAGEAVVVARHSANRDEDAFEAPDVFDPRRTPNPHLGFGFGPHACAGGQLARLEMQIALASFARRLPDLHLTIPQEKVPWLTSARERRPSALPVTW